MGFELCHGGKDLNMTILLTGVAGFIGARTAELLLDAGHVVVGVDNLNDYYPVALKEHRLSALRGRPGFSFHAVDVEDRAALAELFKAHRFDGVINLAARAGVRASMENPQVYLSTNTLGTLNLLDLMVHHGVPRYVMASTSSLYAAARPPFNETADITRPISPYAATKLAAEALAHVWHHVHGLRVAVLRYFTVFGPAGRPDMSPFKFIECVRRGRPLPLFGDGSQTRDFTYIDDVARGTVDALQLEGFEIINLGGGNQPISIRAMIDCIAREVGRPAVIQQLPPNPVDMAETSADISKAARLLAWRPQVTPFDGFARTVAWHRANAAWLDAL
jgi:nucleoside-diphosphate-sugar epimerase